MPQPNKVLIVDDEDVLAENLQAYFQRRGWDARIAGTGKSAVIAATEFRPGMILLDYDLPDMTGFEALEAIRAAHCCTCILMSGEPGHALLAGVKQRGIARILVKPYGGRVLCQMLREQAATQPVRLWRLLTPQ